MAMAIRTPDRTDVVHDARTRRFSLPALIGTALVSLLIGYFAGQGVEQNNVDQLPGGAPTDNVSGNTPSDR
jgi:hypothetical protein